MLTHQFQNEVARAVILALVVTVCTGRAATAGWAVNGNVVADSLGDQTLPSVLGTTNGALVSWQDYRRLNLIGGLGFGAEFMNLSGFRHDSGPMLFWSNSQVIQNAPMPMVPDGSAGAIVSWFGQHDTPAFRGVQAARVTSTGELTWVQDLIELGSAALEAIRSAKGSDGSYFVGWSSRASGSTWRSFAKGFDASGAPLSGWPTDGLEFGDGTSANRLLRALVPDSAGGVFAFWTTDQSANEALWGNHLSSAGDTLAPWPHRGTLVLGGGTFENVVAAADDSGGAYLAWQDKTGPQIFSLGRLGVLRLGGSGQPSPGWPTGGIVACDSGGVSSPQLAADASGAVLAWQDYRPLLAPLNPRSTDLYCTRVLPDGALASGFGPHGVAACLAVGAQAAPALAPTGSGGFIVAWLDERSLASTGQDIYAALLSPSGVNGTQPDGLLVCGAANNQHTVRLVPDGGGGALAVWIDGRSSSGDLAVYSQRILATGVLESPSEAPPAPVGRLRAWVPKHGTVRCEIDSPVGTTYSVRLYDLSGRCIAREFCALGRGRGTLEVNLSTAAWEGLVPGLCFIRVTWESGQAIGKLVILQ